jgi:hypothetical protein
MYASVHKHSVPDSWLVRSCGRIGGLVIVLGWLPLVISEIAAHGPPVLENYYQGAMLAIVFIGYAVGWRYEVLGGALAIIGTVGFIALYVAMFTVFPLAGAIGFAAPGIFYLIAHYLDASHGEQTPSEP